MIPLPETYKKNTFQFKIVERDDDTAIAEQWDVDETPFLVAYEVFIIKKVPEFKIPSQGNKVYPAKEQVPSNEEWGTLGYTCHTLEKAYKRREDLRNFLKDTENNDFKKNSIG